MNEDNHTLQTAECLIREWFPRQFGDRYRIVGSSFGRCDGHHRSRWLSPRSGGGNLA